MIRSQYNIVWKFEVSLILTIDLFLENGHSRQKKHSSQLQIDPVLPYFLQIYASYVENGEGIVHLYA